MKFSRVKIRKIAFILLGMLFVIPGLIISVSPLPLGFILLVPGLVLLIVGSRHVRRWIRHRREHNREINARISDVEDHMPSVFGRVLKLTRPRKTSN